MSLYIPILHMKIGETESPRSMLEFLLSPVNERSDVAVLIRQLKWFNSTTGDQGSYML